MIVKIIALAALLTFVFPQAETVTLDGIVMPDSSEVPLPSVQIRLVSAKPGDMSALARAVTGTDGRFHISAPPGEYRLLVHRDGYFGPPKFGIPQDSVERKVTLRAGPPQDLLRISLTPGGVVTGQLLDSTGLPAGKSTVSVFQMAYRDGRLALRQVESESSNERGEYRLYWIPPGDYMVSFDPGQSSVATATVVTSNGQPGVQMRTFFPGTLDVSKARSVTIAPGAEVAGVNFAILTLESVSIAGKVENPFAPAAGPNTSLLELPGFTLVPREFSGSGNIVMSTFANSVSPADRQQGSFELRGIPSSLYELFVNVNATSFALNYMARMPIDVRGQSLKDLAITVHPPAEVHGRIVTSAEVSLPSKFAVSLIPAENLPTQGGLGVTITADADGSFVFKSLVDGAYRLVMPNAGSLDYGVPERANAYVADILQGTQSRLGDGIINVSPGMEPIQLILAPTTARISGSVTFADGKPGLDTTVALVPNSPLRNSPTRYRIARPDDSGAFTLANIAPGSYKLFAWDGVLATAWLNAEFLSRYESDGVPITVEANQEIAGQKISGIRLGAQRTP
jgi:5-hydroxyisourate hydrolase-like protein (transthyretin family)